MAKRFIDTEIFNDPWFMDLTPSAKLLYVYFFTNCDHAGIIEFNVRLAEVQIGIENLSQRLNELMEELNDRVKNVKGRYYFLPKFLKFQYPNFPNSKVKQQASAINRLKSFGLFHEENLTLSKGLANPYDNGNENVYEDVNKIKVSSETSELRPENIAESQSLLTKDELNTEMTSDKGWLISVKNSTKVDVLQLQKQIPPFLDMLESRFELERPIKIIKAHFANWIRDQVNRKLIVVPNEIEKDSERSHKLGYYTKNGKKVFYD